MQQKWFVYILECADRTLYTGVTTEIERRLAEHNGLIKGGARYTRHRRPVSLVYQEDCLSRSDACRREYEIKQMNSVQKRLLYKDKEPN